MSESNKVIIEAIVIAPPLPEESGDPTWDRFCYAYAYAAQRNDSIPILTTLTVTEVWTLFRDLQDGWEEGGPRKLS